MPRECGWCGHPDRQAWEQRVLEGHPVAVVTADTPFSLSAANRHLRLHLRPGIRAQLGSSAAPVHLADFASKLLHLVSAGEEVQRYAEATSNASLLLKSLQSQRDSLTVLMTRLGVDSEETVELHQQAQALTKALAAIVRSDQHPGLAADLADRLDDAGHAQLAATIRTVDTTTQHHLEEKNQ